MCTKGISRACATDTLEILSIWDNLDSLFGAIDVVYVVFYKPYVLYDKKLGQSLCWWKWY